uniref:Ig-like domain-containing protein n=1 Tax=Sander lucioperca TaxID=283035 RepID=A0A8C9ZCH7_SANLU
VRRDSGGSGHKHYFVFFSLPEPPWILEKPESMNVLPAGDMAALEVKVCGTPALIPKWFKDGVELASGRKYKISFSQMISSLNVLSAEKLDSGEYTFEVMNEVGKDLSKINLTVLGWCLLPTWSLMTRAGYCLIFLKLMPIRYLRFVARNGDRCKPSPGYPALPLRK